MRTNASGHYYDLDKFHTIQARGVRLPTVRLRGTVAVRVASTAAPSPRGLDAPAFSDVRGSISLRARSEGAAGAGRKADAAPVPAPAPSNHDDDADASVEQAANLERAASSGLATTSTSASAPSSQRARSGGSGGRSGGKGKGHGRRLEPREYTARLSAASSVAELQLLFELGRGQDINAIHVATLWSRLAKLVSSPAAPSSSSSSPAKATAAAAAAPARGPGRNTATEKAPKVPGAAEADGGDQQRQPRPQPQRAEPEAVAAFVAALQATTTPEQLESMEPRGLANVLWAAAKLKPHDSGAATAAAGQEAPASNAAAAAASGTNDAVALTQQQQQEQDAGQGEQQGQGPRQRPPRIRGGKTALAAAAAKAAAEAEAERAGRTSASEALLEAWAAAAGRKLASFNAQDLANVVWALGRLGYQPRGLFMKQLSVALLKELPRMDRPQQLSNVLLGLALLRFAPPVKDFWPPLWQALNRVVLSEQKVPDVQGVSNTLWSLGQLTAHCPADMPPVPDGVVSKAVFRAVQWGARMSATQVQDVFTSLPHLGFEPSEYQTSKLLGLAHRVLPSGDVRALSNILMALLQMRVRLPREWTRNLLAAFHRQLSESSLESVARLLFCLGTIRFTRPRWLPEVWSRLQRDVRLMTASDIAFTVLAIDRLYPELARRDTKAEEAEEEEEEEEVVEQQLQQTEAETEVVLSAGDGKNEEEEEEEEEDVVKVREGGADAVGAAKAATNGGAAAAATGDPAVVAALAVSEAAAEGPAAEAEGSRGPSRELLVALRDAWEALGPEAQLSVVFAYRAYVQEFFAAALPAQ